MVSVRAHTHSSVTFLFMQKGNAVAFPVQVVKAQDTTEGDRVAFVTSAEQELPPI